MKRVASGGWQVAFIIFFLLLLVGRAAAQSADTLSVANRLYERGNYAESSRLYQELVEQGYSDPALFHNLGNASMQQGEVGRAIVNYKRVLRIDPQNAESLANLAQVESSVINQFTSAENTSLTDVLMTTTNYLTRNQIALLALGLWVVWGIVYLLHRRVFQAAWSRVLLLLLTLGAFVAAVTFFSIAWSDRTQPEAVIVVPQAEVYPRAEVAERSLFNLPDGTAVRVIDEHSDWVQVSLVGNDLNGWVTAESVVLVAP